MPDKYYIPGQRSSVPGVDYQPIAPTTGGSYIPGQSAEGSKFTRGTKSYERNLETIRKAEEQYAREAEQAQREAEERSKKKAPMWKKGLGIVAKGLQYTSGSEWAYKVPGVGDDIQSGVEKVPGLRTALAAATNPLTYLAPGVGGAGVFGANLSTRAAIQAGLLTSLGAGAGEAALSEEGLGLDIPGVSEKYEGMVGGAVGGLAGMGGASAITRGGIGNIPGLGRAVPGSMKELGIDATANAARQAELAARRMAKARTTGFAQRGQTLFTRDGIEATATRPTPLKSTLQLTIEDLGDPNKLLADAANNAPDPDNVYLAVTRAQAYGIANDRLAEGSKFYDDLAAIEPGETVIRVPRKYTQIDPETGRPTLKGSLGSESVKIYTRDEAGGDAAWKTIKGLVDDSDDTPWREIAITDDAVGKEWLWDDALHKFVRNTEEARQQRAAIEAARMVDTGAKGVTVEAPPIPEGQMPMGIRGGPAIRDPLTQVPPQTPRPEFPVPTGMLGDTPAPAPYQPKIPGMDRYAPPTPRPAPEAPEGMRQVVNPRGRPRSAERRVDIFDDPQNPRIREIIDATMDETIEGGGGSSTNILGEPMRTGNGLSINPERTRVIPAAEFNRSPETAISAYYNANKDLLHDGQHYLGTWRDPQTGNISLDVSVNISDRAEAMRLAEQYNQKAIYDLDAGEVVPNPNYDPTRGAEAVAAGTADEVAEATARVPNAQVQASARAYAAERGLTLPDTHPYVEVDPVEAKRIADEYAALNPLEAQTPGEQANTRFAYNKAGGEVQEQWDWATQRDGMTFEPWTQEGQPYAGAQEMRDDVLNNKHLYFFTGGTEHPLWGEATRDATGLTLNDKFRAVHDYFGHAQEGMNFGPRGEENAWIIHSQMFSDAAQAAITTETRGQNSVVNFANDAIRGGGAPVVFPEQKAALMSPRTRDWQAVLVERAGAPAPGADLPTQRMSLTHYGSKELSEIDPAFQGQGIPSAELKTAGLNPNEQARFQSFYEEGATPEKWFVDQKTGAQRPGIVKHAVEGDFKILDLNSDEGRAFRQRVANEDLDSALVKSGYDGYKVGDQGTVRMFGKRQVTAVNDVPVQKTSTGIEVLPDGSATDVAFAAPRKTKSSIAEDMAGGAMDDVGRPIDVPGAPGGLERRRVRRTGLEDVIAAKAERRSITDPNEARRFEQQAGVRKSMEELAIDKGEMRPGEQPVNPRGRPASKPEGLSSFFAKNEEDLAAMRAGKPKPSEARVYIKEIRNNPDVHFTVDKEVRFNADGTIEERLVRRHRRGGETAEAWEPRLDRNGDLEAKLKADGYDKAFGSAADEMSPRVSAVHNKLSALETPNTKTARAAIQKLRDQGVFVDDTESALDEIDTLTRSDFDTAAEFREARQEAWDDALDTLANTTDEVNPRGRPRSGEIPNPALEQSHNERFGTNPRGRAKSQSPVAVKDRFESVRREMERRWPFSGRTSPRDLTGGEAREYRQLSAEYRRLAKQLQASETVSPSISRIVGDAPSAVSDPARAAASAEAADDLLRSIADDLGEDVSERARPATTGTLRMKNTVKTESGDWFADRIEQLMQSPKTIANGTIGSKTVQDILGRMGAAMILRKGNVTEADWVQFAARVKEDLKVDLLGGEGNFTFKQSGKSDTLFSLVKKRSIQYATKMSGKTPYKEGGSPNMRRVINIIKASDPESGKWYEGTLPWAYEQFGEQDGDMFIKFLGVLGQSAGPRENLQMALDAFADWKLGYLSNTSHRVNGATDDIMERLRFVVNGGDVTGMKISSYTNNLSLDDFNVTVDRWMYRLFGYEYTPGNAGSDAMYEIISQQIRDIGTELGMTPREVQARLWVGVRNEMQGGVNEPFEALALGAGRYDDAGKLYPDVEGPEGLPSAKRTLDAILRMRDQGIIDLPTDTQAAQLKAQDMIRETMEFRQGKVEASIEQARKLADEKGIPYSQDEDALSILDRVYDPDDLRGPTFTPDDLSRVARADAERYAERGGTYEPSMRDRESPFLDEWANGEREFTDLSNNAQNISDEFRMAVSNMDDAEIIQRYHVDTRTPQWQRQLMWEENPGAVQSGMGDVADDVAVAERARLRINPFSNKAPTPLHATEGGVEALAQRTRGAAAASPEGVRPSLADNLKDDLHKAGLADEKIEEILESRKNELGEAQSRGAAPETGQAVREASRAEALNPNPKGVEATLRRRSQDPNVLKVNNRPVIDVTGNADVERALAEAPWVSPIDELWAGAIDTSVGRLAKTALALEGTGPKSGGIYYRAGEVSVYNDVGAAGGLVERAETTVHLNPVDLYDEAAGTAKRENISMPEALARELQDSSDHEIAHDLVYHGKKAANNEEKFMEVYAAIKNADPEGRAAEYQRLVSSFKKMDEDGTLLKWENDNARIRRTANTGTGTGEQGRLLPADAADGAAQGRPGLGRVEGAAAPDTAGWGRPAGDVRGTGSGTPERAGLPESRAARTVTRTDDISGANPRGRTASAPGQPNAAGRVITPAPRVLDKAGDGKVFETPVPKGQRISAAPRSMDDVAGDIFKDNNMRRAAARLSKRNPVVKRFLTTVSGKAATAEEGIEKEIAIYAVKTDVDRSRVVGMMAELRQAKRPFDRLEGNLTNVTDWRGNKAVAPLGDVISHPENFRLSAAQKGYIDRFHRITDELVDDARAQGIDIKELGLFKDGDGHYVPRWVQGADGVDIESQYTKGGLGTKQRFEKTRQYDTEADAMANGIQYHDTEQALANFAEAIMKRTRDAEVIARVKQYGRSASELVGPGPRAALDAQGAKQTAARKALAAAKREVDRLTGKNIEVQAGRKTLSPADIRAMVAKNADVVKAQDDLKPLIARRDELQTKFNAAKTPAAQGRLEMQLDAIKGKVAQAQDDLKATRKRVRADISGADAADVTRAKTGSKAALKDARAALAKAQADFDNISISTARTKSDYRTIIRNKQSTFRESGLKFGMGGDIIPVRMTRELPGLQNRIFPSEVMDVLERGLGDKGSQALTKVASVNDLARMFTTSTDFGATMLQGLPVLAYNPKAWAKASIKSIRAWFDPQSLQSYYATNREVVNEMAHYVGGLSSNEFFSSAVGGKTLIGKVAQSDVPLLALPAQSVERFGVSFDTFLDVAKIEMWKSLRHTAGGNSAKLEELGRFVRNMTGTTSTARLGVSTTQRQVESLLMFSPRFTRSVFALGAQAFEAGASGAQARRALGGLIIGSMIAYAGIKTMLNKTGVTEDKASITGVFSDPLSLSNWKDFDPTQGGRFMSIKVGDNYIGIGGSMRGAIQLLGSSAAAAVTEPKKFLSGETVGRDANPFLRYARGRSSPLTGEGWNVLTGKDAIGNEFESRTDWLQSVPDAFVPFALQSLAETEGGWESKAGIFAGQSIGMRTFPESKNEDLSTMVKDTLKKITPDTPGFSEAEREEIDVWADLTKFQKQTLLQRNPELRQQLDRKERDFWDERKQLQTDANDAKRTLGQRLLTTRSKMERGESLTVDDLTPQQYREALADIQQKQRAAEAQLRGANAITGLGGEEFNITGARTHRQAVMDAYYQNVDSQSYVDASTGQVDFNRKDEVEAKYLAALPEADRKIIEQEKGAEYDLVAREFRTAKLSLAEYWNLGDEVARRMGFANAQDLDVNGTPNQKTRYNATTTALKERYRRQHLDVDALLIDWDYASTPILEQSTGRAKPRKGARRVTRTPSRR